MTWSTTAELAPHIAAALNARLASHGARVERATEALRRTNAIIDRLCPAVALPSFSSRYSELNGSARAWERFHDNTVRRKALYRAIKPRMDAKVQARRNCPVEAAGASAVNRPDRADRAERQAA